MNERDKSAVDNGLEVLLEFLRTTRAIDFTGYKRPSLGRRVRKRMQEVSLDDYAAYQDLLEADPGELSALVDTILINVTGFFRDTEAWAHLAESVVPEILDAKAPDEPVRIWSAGCASGEEAYTLAMIFADHLGIDEFKSRVKIFATDTDENALARGRAAVYSKEQLEPIPDDKRDRFFEPVPLGFQFRNDCRRSIIFGHHDITSDAPISRLDLLVCRNVLMYFVAETQRRALGRFHYALQPRGVLFLGKAETIFSHNDLFTAIDMPMRIFRRTARPTSRTDLVNDLSDVAVTPQETASVQLHELAAASTPVAQLVIDVDGRLIALNNKARSLFGLTRDDVGRPFAELQVSYRPVELRSRIEQAYAESTPIVIRDVSRPLPDGKQQFLEVTVAPLLDPAGIDLGVAITFADVTELGRTKSDLERSAKELRAAYEGVETANVRLETSNEELQSTNEELETTNEELQSANEELETMNEELQSANEELETMNEELLLQAAEIEEGEQFLGAILNGLPTGVVVLTQDLDVVVWNDVVVDLFGLRADEVKGRSFLALDISLPVGELSPLLHQLLDDPEPPSSTFEIVDRRGRAVHCTVSIRHLAGPVGSPETQQHVLVLLWPEGSETT